MVNDVILVRFTLSENLVVQINILDGIFFCFREKPVVIVGMLVRLIFPVNTPVIRVDILVGIIFPVNTPVIRVDILVGIIVPGKIKLYS